MLQNTLVNLQIQQFILALLQKSNIPLGAAKILSAVLILLFTTLISLLLFNIVKKILRFFLIKVAIKTNSNFDDTLVRNKFSYHLSKFIPVVLLDVMLPTALVYFPKAFGFFQHVIQLMYIYVTVNLIRVILKSINDYIRKKPLFKEKPIDSYFQVANIIQYCIAGILAFSIITNKSPNTLFAALGAASAILILVFKDTILGFVASIQVSTNDMVRIGDWIEMPKYGADGHVTQITLTTVKVKNWDMTITTIPTYALISDSFKNWRGMQHSGGRRIMRSLTIKMSSIKFLSDADLENLKKIEIIRPYLEGRIKEIHKHNKDQNIDKDALINGRNLTNIGVFRIYIETYLQQNRNINPKMWLLVRQLQATEFGLPIQIYAFSKDTRLIQYEHIMADIFDHIIASISYFDLQIYQAFSNQDFNPKEPFQ